MNHRKILTGAFVFVFLGAVAASKPASAEIVKIKLYGGYGYLLGGDLNSGTQGFLDLWTDMIKSGGWTASGTFNAVHFGPEFGGDVILQISPAFGIGLGAGYVKAANDTSMIYTKTGSSGSLTASSWASAIPLKAGIYLSVPSDFVTFTIHFGAGYYLAKMSADFRLEEGGVWDRWNNAAEARGIGYHGGIGLEFHIMPNLAFFIEAQGRYAKLGGFEGTLEESGSSDITTTEKGKLYYFEDNESDDKFYPIIMISATAPTPSQWTRNIREAKIDFSGGTAVAGIIIKF